MRCMSAEAIWLVTTFDADHGVVDGGVHEPHVEEVLKDRRRRIAQERILRDLVPLRNDSRIARCVRCSLVLAGSGRRRHHHE
jgi:hypothetical protein